jgi:acetyltransferase-like isoleucine patch superfamily enzyme
MWKCDETFCQDSGITSMLLYIGEEVKGSYSLIHRWGSSGPANLKLELINYPMIEVGVYSDNIFDWIDVIINAKEISRSVIGIRSRIGEETIIQNSYVMGNDLYQNIDDMNADIKNNKQLMGIGERCFINNAIIDKNCRIGNDVYINGGKHLMDSSNELYAVKDGIVVVKKGVVLTDNYSIK